MNDLHPDLVALKVHVDRLHSLLAAPEPGLTTWNEAVRDNWQAVIDLANPMQPVTKLTAAEVRKGRSASYHSMTSEEQWAEDKRLEILDWDGS